LRDIREARDARFIATAHQKNDQAETVLMRLLTGSGINGLRGIHPMRDDGVIRPLLDLTRAELEAVLAAHDITPRFDRSNDDQRFLRNRVRAFLRDVDATEPLARMATEAREQWPILERAIDEAERDCAQIEPAQTRFTHFPEDEWLRGALLQRHIRRLDPRARDHDARAIDINQKRVSITKQIELTRETNEWILRKRTASPAKPTAFEEIHFETTAHIPALNKTIHVHRQPPTANRQLFQLPTTGPTQFTVRTRRPGDRFQPLGLAHPKKLKDFLIDRKIARDCRDRLPLLLWNGEIVWIAGVEISERFKVTCPVRGTLYEVWLEGSGADDADHSPV
jgi:tRNA(Ile)-lysidine synthase